MSHPLIPWLAPVIAVASGFKAQSELWSALARLKREEHEQRLRETGLRGSARLVNSTHVGMTFNEDAKMSCTFEIVLPNALPYTVTRELVFPMARIGRLTSDAPMTVYVNPMDVSDVEIDW